MNEGIPKDITLMQHLVPLAASLLITAVTVELIRRRKLREEYAMLWLGASAVLLVFAIFPRLLWHLSRWLGVYYLTVMILLSFSFLALLVIHLAVVISRLADDQRQIAQRLALTEQRLMELQKQQPFAPTSPSNS
jgi:hypothetical protein